MTILHCMLDFVCSIFTLFYSLSSLTTFCSDCLRSTDHCKAISQVLTLSPVRDCRQNLCRLDSDWSTENTVKSATRAFTVDFSFNFNLFFFSKILYHYISHHFIVIFQKSVMAVMITDQHNKIYMDSVILVYAVPLTVSHLLTEEFCFLLGIMDCT